MAEGNEYGATPAGDAESSQPSTPHERLDASIPAELDEGEAAILIMLSRLTMRDRGMPDDNPAGYEGPETMHYGADGYN